MTAPPGRDEDGEFRRPVRDADVLHARLRAFFARTSPPASALAREYVAWIEELLGPDPAAIQQDEADLLQGDADAVLDDFDLYGQIRRNSDATVAVRDLYCDAGLAQCRE